jgi:hypothetical protein
MNVIEHAAVGQPGRFLRRITVRTAAYAFAGPVGEEPNVWCGLEFEVTPSSLVWLDCGNDDALTNLAAHFDGGRNETTS